MAQVWLTGLLGFLAGLVVGANIMLEWTRNRVCKGRKQEDV
jgi:uncharacterized membrane-anchored protein YhcB (DUF1043 family)